MTFYHYDKDLTSRSRKLRTQMTRGEIILWTRLRGKQLGVGFKRQRPIGNYIADFYCPRLKLVVEVDGASHDDRLEADAARDGFMERQGITVLRFSDFKVLDDEDTVVDEIERVVGMLTDDRP